MFWLASSLILLRDPARGARLTAFLGFGARVGVVGDGFGVAPTYGLGFFGARGGLAGELLWRRVGVFGVMAGCYLLKHAID